MKTCEVSATYKKILLLFATKSNAMPREGDQNLRMLRQTLEKKMFLILEENITRLKNPKVKCEIPFSVV